MNVNFAFLRHGYGCHNAMSGLAYGDVVSKDHAIQFMKPSSDKNILRSGILPLNDPVLTNIGVEASVYNGCIVNKILKRLSKISGDDRLNMDTFNVVGCSPLIRCMETAYYMTRDWRSPPDKIYVFPLLREIDESSVDKYSTKSREVIRVTPSYAIKTIQEQKDYLKGLGILDYFDFSFVEAFPQERIEPGDIGRFMEWFSEYFVKLLDRSKLQNLNVFVTTHAGVLREFADEGFYNNSGFVINTIHNGSKFKTNNYISLNRFIDDYNFFKDYANPKYNSVKYYCPSNRCGQLCSVVKTPPPDVIKTIGLQCSPDEAEAPKTPQAPLLKRTFAIRRKSKPITVQKQEEDDGWDDWD